MKNSTLKRLSKIGLILGVVFLLVQFAFSGTVSARSPKLFQQKSAVVQGKIVGNKLMLIDKTGRQTLAPDGVYKIRDGSKISVNQGQIIDVPGRVIDRGGMVGIIEIPD